ncbi:rhodanese-like domain-containing protein [Erythrobacter sp. HA6-11]
MQGFKLIGAALALTLAGCASLDGAGQPATSTQATLAGASVETLPAKELASLIEAGEVVLIDVRTPTEFASGRLSGALNAPVGSFDAGAIPRDATRETILYCRSSGRSKRAAEMLAAEWGTQVRHLEGGILAWREAELPVTSPD